MLEELLRLYALKSLKRTGWVMNGIKEPETVASHSFGTAFLAFQLGRLEHVNLDHALHLALFHDFQEVFSGDFTPYDAISETEKHELEQRMAQRISALLDQEAYAQLCAEYIAGETPESRFVHAIDKLDMWLTALMYERTQGRFLGDFFSSMKESEFASVNAVAAEIRELRESRVHGSQ